MNKEKIENFDKEQLELLLNDLQDIDKFTGFKNGAFKYELGKYQASLLVNYIKKQKEVINNAIEYIEKHTYHDTPKKLQNGIYERGELIIKNDFYIEDLVDILKGSDKE